MYQSFGETNITIVLDDDKVVEEYLPKANIESRICNSCNQTKPLSDYPKKGAGRYEDKCKPCHNKFKKERRQSSKPVEPAAWSLKSIRHSVEFTSNKQSDFVDVLYSLLKAEVFVNNPEQIQTIESLINETSNI
jgi:hypothetical protein